jgi:hypothetical protein
MDSLPIHDDSAHRVGYFTIMDRSKKTVFCVEGTPGISKTKNQDALNIFERLKNITDDSLI